MSVINQKEYLKKYLGIGKKLGKKKKTKKTLGNKVTIIDDDVESNTFAEIIEEDPFTTNEDAPQIVAVIDERPPSLRIDEKTKDSLWKPIGSANDDVNENTKSNVSFTLLNQKDDKCSELKSKKMKRSENLGNDSSLSRGKRSPKDLFPDNSPPRRRRAGDLSPKQKSLHNTREIEIKTESLDNDSSPPRRQRTSKVTSPDNSPPRRKRPGDSSPKQKLSKSLENDSSPPRRKRKPNGNSSQVYENSPVRRAKVLSPDNSPPRRKRSELNSKDSPKQPPKKLTKTLDGKTAGLQNAKELAHETKQFRKREDDVFNQMSNEISGRNATTIFRDRKTGKERDLKKEFEQKQLENEKDEKRKEKYSRWGKGLTQVEQINKRHEYEMEEMNKPLARYADDADLENYLKRQEREGDPMLAYIRSKRRKEAVEKNETVKPQYQGEFMPNRFGIRPGHRWDGVDRSNGYETKWFEVQNAKRAQEETSYKWSTEDM